MKRCILHTDGASSGNPGESGIGIVIDIDGKKLELSEYIGRATNNVAEYKALIKGLEKAKDFRVGRIEILLDSELLVKQLKGEYKVKNETLKELYNRVVALLKDFESYVIRHVPREKNTDADRLAKRAIKERYKG